MIEITHTPYEGSVARGVPKDAGLTEILKAIGWRWWRPMEAWRLPGSRNHAANRSLLDRTAIHLTRVGFDVSLRIDEDAKSTATSYSDRWVGRQIARLEENLRKVDSKLEDHFRAIETAGESSVEADLWSIRMLLRRTDIVEELRRWTEVRAEMAEGAPGHTPKTIEKGDYVRISGRWRKVARVNEKSVTVETEHSRTSRGPYYEITGHRPAHEPEL
ncbi:MAG TPA: hypothetical protein VGL05_15530 [Kribbella sp.]